MLDLFRFACKVHCLMPSGTAGLARSARKQTYREKGRKAGDSSDLTEGVGEKTERKGRKKESEHSLGAEVFKGIKKKNLVPATCGFRVAGGECVEDDLLAITV